MQCPVYNSAWLPCERSTKAQRTRPSVSVPRDIDDVEHGKVIAEIETPVAKRERQTRVYLKSVPGTQEGTGADRSCASLTMRLLYGFGLPADTALKMLVEWGQKTDQLDMDGGWYPWTE
jgi:hypothetical protein